MMYVVVALALVLSGAEEYGIMHPNLTTLHQWSLARIMQQDYHSLGQSVLPSRVNLLPHLSYPQAKRNQGRCGNCWVWASTAAVEIRASFQGVKDALSVQYLTSGFGSGSNGACCGGTLSWFAGWYGIKGWFVALSNKNADYTDYSTKCGKDSKTDFGNILVTANHPIEYLMPFTLVTRGKRSRSITAIKSALARGYPVLYSFALPDKSAWEEFYSFWDTKEESSLWNPNVYNGKVWDNNTGGAHMVVIVGYDDSNHSWIALNSWGVSKRRPHGTFSLPQNMNYNAFIYMDRSTRERSNWFEVIDVGWVK